MSVTSVVSLLKILLCFFFFFLLLYVNSGSSGFIMVVMLIFVILWHYHSGYMFKRHALYCQTFLEAWPLRPHVHHPQTVAFKVQSMQLYKMSLYDVAFPFTGTKRPKPVPAWRCPCMQSKLHEDMAYQG